MIKTRMCNFFYTSLSFLVYTESERGNVCKITLQSPGLFNDYFTEDNFRF